MLQRCGEKIYWNSIKKAWEWSSAVKWEQSRAGCRKYLLFVWRASLFSDFKKSLNWNHISVPSSHSQAGWVEFADTYTHLNKQNRSLPVSLYTFLAVSLWPSLLRLTLPVQETFHEGTDFGSARTSPSLFQKPCFAESSTTILPVWGLH